MVSPIMAWPLYVSTFYHSNVLWLQTCQQAHIKELVMHQESLPWKELVGNSCIFSLNSAAAQHFSRRPASRGAADIIKTEDAMEIILSRGVGGEGPNIFCPHNSVFNVSLQ